MNTVVMSSQLSAQLTAVHASVTKSVKQLAGYRLPIDGYCSAAAAAAVDT